ncbi:hypothetical protein L1987_33191 [Smallanthus sonchifolius]|uniref:Uncharacterized protein n=1 Tax=Smallanthus sonchifolius TaxID=185202 RepID=A0ACB9HRK2_9ASTR|nr:hypothetical protein L1987_33191 [Smallanthus sonchifolius]
MKNSRPVSKRHTTGEDTHGTKHQDEYLHDRKLYLLVIRVGKHQVSPPREDPSYGVLGDNLCNTMNECYIRPVVGMTVL